MQELDRRIAGVLGQDVLRSTNWWLDYQGRVLVADTEGKYLPRGLGERVDVHWQAERPAVDVLLPDRKSLRLDVAPDRAEDGLLPTGLFEGIDFDNRAGAVVFNPRRSALSRLPDRPHRAQRSATRRVISRLSGGFSPSPSV